MTEQHPNQGVEKTLLVGNLEKLWQCLALSFNNMLTVFLRDDF